MHQVVALPSVLQASGVGSGGVGCPDYWAAASLGVALVAVLAVRAAAFGLVLAVQSVLAAVWSQAVVVSLQANDSGLMTA